MSLPHTKERHRKAKVRFNPVEYFDGSKWKILPLSEGVDLFREWDGKQVTVSEGHRKSRDGTYHVGGPFYSAQVKPSIKTRNVSAVQNTKVEPKRYIGPTCIPVPTTGMSGSSLPSQDDSHLDPIGADAIHAVDPTNSNASTGIALAEMKRDGIPIPVIQGWKRRTELAKAAGSEYLNAVFGWLPLVSDIKDTAQSIRDGNTIIENYRSASGTLVHREFAFPTITSTEESVIDATAHCFTGNISSSALRSAGVPLTRRRDTTIRRWFSGSFTYMASPASSLQRCLGVNSEIDKLYGLTLTPDAVWELTPWSWAIDWFTNAGEVISNLSSFEIAGLVIKYGYIMEEKSILDTYSMPGTGLVSVLGPPPDCTVLTTVKRRKEANPFGFGVSWDGLSPTQLAITAALGITRLR